MKDTNNIKRLLRFLKPYKKLFIIAQISMLIAASAALAFPWIIKNVLDMLLNRSDLSILIYLIGVLAVILVLEGVANYYKKYSLGVIGQHIVKDLRVEMFEKIQWMSINFFHMRKSGDIISGMTNDINTIQSVLSQGITYFIQNIISLVFAAVLI
jgi:ABC-type multidrug transport system fused ATPase/permease subunit